MMATILRDETAHVCGRGPDIGSVRLRRRLPGLDRTARLAHGARPQGRPERGPGTREVGRARSATGFRPGHRDLELCKRSNTNDVAATLLYTNTKEGDQGEFIDLTFVDGKLTSWKETTHTMPTKNGGPGLSFGVSGPGSAVGNRRHY